MSNTPRIAVRKIHPAAILPHYQTPGASGADVCAALDTSIEIEAGARILVPSGLEFEIPYGWEIQVRPRSGLAIKHGITLLNSPGTIDSDYRGELKIIVFNAGSESYVIKPGDRIAQIIVAPAPQADFTEVETLGSTQRGSHGFGSTGT